MDGRLLKRSSSSFDFLSSVSTRLGGYFIDNLIDNVSNNLSAFTLSFPTGLGGFLALIEPLVFLPFLPSG